MSEFSGISDVTGWSKKLDSMLKECEDIAKKDELSPRIAMSKRLTQFIVKSFPNTPEVKALDDLAHLTSQGLLKSAIDDRLAELASHNAAYAKLTKEFKTRAEENNAAADSIRFKGIVGTLDAATDLIEEAKKLKDSLKDNASEKKVADLIDETVAAIEKLRSKVGRLA